MIKYHIECLPEEVLLLNMGLTRESLLHHSGSGGVCQTLSDGSNLIGLIDEDPERKYQHSYYSKLYLNPVSDLHNIRYSIDKAKKNKMIFIKPRFEPWIIEVAQNSGVNMADFNLSGDANLLHREINFKKTDLQKLLHMLKKVKSPAILRLKELINP
ncbi:MAG: hypothetical protein ABI480_08340 [Chitinophagaceae bacterium]